MSSAYKVKLSDGRTLKVTAESPEMAAKVAARWEAQQDPAYQTVRRRSETRANLRRENNLRFGGRMIGGLLNASDEFQSQIGRNVGVLDDMAGAAAFVEQGARNIARSMTGQPITVPANVAYQAAADYEREQQADYARRRPTADLAASAVGIMTSGRPVAGAAPFTNPVRAAQVAAAQTAPFAVARQEGDLVERLPGAAAETAIAAGLGAGLTAGANVLRNRAIQAAARPMTNARRLANEGVELTPGQMTGGALQRIEDGATSFPIVGDSIRGAQTRSLESFDRAAINRGLAEIGERLPDNVNVGRDGVAYANRAVSAAYDRALSPVTVAPDQAFDAAVQSIRARPGLQGQAADEVAGVIDDVVARLSQGPVDGNAFKMIDADVGAAARAARTAAAQTPSMSRAAQALDEVGEALDDLLGRIDPNALAGKRAADAAFANMWRVERAAGGVGARGGVFTAPQLSSAVRAGDTGRRAAFARGEALMQDLSDAGTDILPSTVPDSGTAFRSMAAIGGGVGLTGVGAVSPEAALTAGIGAGTVSALYSRPVLNLLNQIYRANRPGQATAALAQLQAMVATNPQLAPIAERAAAYLGVSVEGPVPVGALQE